MTILSRRQFLYLIFVVLLLLTIACGGRGQTIRDMTAEKLEDMADKLADEGVANSTLSTPLGIIPADNPPAASPAKGLSSELPSPTYSANAFPSLIATVAPTSTPLPATTVAPTSTPLPTTTVAPTSTPLPATTTLIERSRIAFMSNRDGANEIYVMNADGSGQTRLTEGFMNETSEPS